MGQQPLPACSFCGKDQRQVRRLIASPRGAYICGECLTLMHDAMLADADGQDPPPRRQAADTAP